MECTRHTPTFIFKCNSLFRIFPTYGTPFPLPAFRSPSPSPPAFHSPTNPKPQVHVTTQAHSPVARGKENSRGKEANPYCISEVFLYKVKGKAWTRWKCMLKSKTTHSFKLHLLTFTFCSFLINILLGMVFIIPHKSLRGRRCFLLDKSYNTKHLKANAIVLNA